MRKLEEFANETQQHLPKIWARYVDDILLYSTMKKTIQHFISTFNSYYSTIQPMKLKTITD